MMDNEVFVAVVVVSVLHQKGNHVIEPYLPFTLGFNVMPPCVGVCVFTCVCVRSGQSESFQAAVSSRQHSEFSRVSNVILASCQC